MVLVPPPAEPAVEPADPAEPVDRAREQPLPGARLALAEAVEQAPERARVRERGGTRHVAGDGQVLELAERPGPAPGRDRERLRAEQDVGVALEDDPDRRIEGRDRPVVRVGQVPARLGRLDPDEPPPVPLAEGAVGRRVVRRAAVVEQHPVGGRDGLPPVRLERPLQFVGGPVADRQHAPDRLRTGNRFEHRSRRGRNNRLGHDQRLDDSVRCDSRVRGAWGH
nr:hypothetical protein [Frigoriglobus tundricola]